MDSRSQDDSDGGGRHHNTPYDQRRAQANNVPPDPGLTNGQLPHRGALLSLDRIRITGSSNEYTEGPPVAQRSPASERRQQKNDLVTSPGPRTSGQQETPEERPNNLRNLPSLTQPGSSNTSLPAREGAPQPWSAGDSRSRDRTSTSSLNQRLIGSSAGSHHTSRSQPKRSGLDADELKPLNDDSRAAVPRSGSPKTQRMHSKCEDCARCRCPECSRPQALPSCWVCGRRCVCSAQSTVEYGTCVCCVKGLFYHCSSDDEDTCADKPFSCTQRYCCMRWTGVSLLSLLFPCLLCYLPAKACAAVCQSCYDRVTRPGCRC
ncbi:protein sprouty homolog 2 [Brachionichthys hirsutus]|uniref:protein sprouty homolog 2 n=1 Tax=Brachionichthys hirsutus TaxID=412623 RepID=UPI00360433A2